MYNKKFDLIDRTPLITSIKRSPAKMIDGKHYVRLDSVTEKIRSAPTIDAVPVVHGRWEWYEYWGSAAFQDPPDIYDAGWACSVCGVELLQYLQSHFPDIPSYTECASEEIPTVERCPNCGAKMDGGAEGWL